jgi:hypothetical protein
LTLDDQLASLHAATLQDLMGMLDVQHGGAAGADADAKAGATYAELGDDDAGDDDAESAATAPLLDNDNSDRESSRAWCGGRGHQVSTVPLHSLCQAC